MLLEIEKITKSFGGLTAVNEVSLSIDQGEIVGLIGPNGAGKTTLMNLISGYYKSDAGRMTFDGSDITGLRPHKICRLGISRTFQIPRPFPDLTALANVGVGVLCGKHRPEMSFGDGLLDASHYLEFVGLFGKRNTLAHDLTLFELRALELARALATTPKLIMIDEVMAGLNPGEAKRAIKLVHRMIEEYRVTIFWIEHVMQVIMEATERVVVLHYGEKIASGPPKEVVNDPKIIEAYLGKPLLKVEDLNVSYGLVQVLYQVGFQVEEGECVAFLGSNGAGKTTLLKTLSGLIKPTSGRISFLGTPMDQVGPAERVESGFIQVPEGGKIFPYMTVWENLLMGASGQKEAWKVRHRSLERVSKLFPIIKERKNNQARLLSGGERQMLVIGRGLMALPKLLMVDEPSLGLAPKILLEIFGTMQHLREEGVTILISEQNVQQALRIADRGYVLENGRVVMEDSSQNLLKSEHIRKAYLGI